MSLRALARFWNETLFAPATPTPIALFRILYGCIMLADLILQKPDWLVWYGPRSWFTIETMHRMEPGTRINLFAILPETNAAVEALFFVFLIATIFLIAGFLTRWSAITVFVCLASTHQRDLYVVHAGNTAMRVFGFWLMFSAAGNALSIDRLIRIWRGREGLEIRPTAPWAQRLIQFELGWIYFVTFCSKTMGPDWWNGTAVYYIHHLTQYKRFPIPEWLQGISAAKVETWVTLAIEFALGVLIWFKETRYTVLLLGLALHASLEYSMNIPLFQWIMVIGYVTFIEPADLTRAWAWLRTRLTKADANETITVVYDGLAPQSARAATLLRAIDILRRLRVVDSRELSPATGPTKALDDYILVETPCGPREGLAGLMYAGRAIPLLWPLAVPSLVTGYFRRPRKARSKNAADAS